VHMSLPLLYIPGFWVSLSLLVAVGIIGTPRHVAIDALSAAWHQFTPSALAILFFLLTAQVMQASSMTASLGATAAALGSQYVWVSPWLAALGAWLTGSNLGGTAMFAQLQKTAASSTGLSLPWLAAAQNGAGALARMLSPACLMLAATSAGLQGQEGLLIRKFGPLVLWAIALTMLLLCGIMIPSSLVICLLVVLLALPCLPTLRPFFLAMPALERSKVSSSGSRKPLHQVRRRTAVVSRKKRAYTLGRRYKKGNARTRRRKGLEKPAFLE
jgi:L-lactate permease